MYYPYFRGKQYELITLRENAHRLGNAIVPIVEPVKSSTRSLERALKELIEVNCRFVVIANPRCGDFSEMAQPLWEELEKAYLAHYDHWSVGYIADARTTREELESVAALRGDVTVIHDGYRSGAELAGMLGGVDHVTRHVFVERSSSSKLYRNHFRDNELVLIRDGFEVRTSREHPVVEHFSDLHATFQLEGMNGFGDFLIVGGEFSEAGGPAYAIAIHLTFIDPDEENDMYVKHYVSDRNASPVDPGGKFSEALAKLVADVNAPGSHILRTDAVREFEQLHERGHYPGLGYVKKLSMQHHIELMAEFLGRDE